MTQPTVIPSRTGANRPLPYLHGSGTREQHRLGRRTAETAAGFFLPHLRPGMRLLDCGCGVGSITIGLAAAVAPGEAIGIDFQSEQIERARAVAGEAGVANVGFAVGSVYALPCPDASYDAAFAHTLLLHLREPPRALRELRRVLKPGGVVGIADDDRGTFLMEPATPLLEALHRLMQRAIQHHGATPSLAATSAACCWRRGSPARSPRPPSRRAGPRGRRRRRASSPPGGWTRSAGRRSSRWSHRRGGPTRRRWRPWRRR